MEEKNTYEKVKINDLNLKHTNVYNFTKIHTKIETDWDKVKGWYDELLFYSKVFQFFVEDIKENESMLGWWIIILSSFTTFVTLLSSESFGIEEESYASYEKPKVLIISSISMITTLIASWIKKKGYVKRIHDIDKRISRLEQFLSKIDYQLRLVPDDKRMDFFEFINTMKDEYTDLAIYTNLISPSEFTNSLYNITKYNAPMVIGTWPWYDNSTGTPQTNFTKHVIDTYQVQYSWSSWLCFICKYNQNNDATNPLLMSEQI